MKDSKNESEIGLDEWIRYRAGWMNLIQGRMNESNTRKGEWIRYNARWTNEWMN